MRRATVPEIAAMAAFTERLLERLLDYADVVPTVSTIPAAPEDEEAAEAG